MSMSKVGRNDPCPCGSGKRYKTCCGNLGSSSGVPGGGTGAADIAKAPGYAAQTSIHRQPRLSPEPTPVEVQELIGLYNAGRHPELEKRARALLERFPDSGIAWHAHGLSLQAQGKESVPSLQKAAELLPGNAEIHNNLGVSLRTGGRLLDAVSSYRRALEVAPAFAAAHSNLGDVLAISGGLRMRKRAIAVRWPSILPRPRPTTTWVLSCLHADKSKPRWKATAKR